MSVARRCGRGPKLPADTVLLEELQLRAEASLEAGDLDTARKDALTVLSRFRSSLWATRMLARVLTRLERYDEALAQYQLVVSVDPLDGSAYRDMLTLANATKNAGEIARLTVLLDDHWSGQLGSLREVPRIISVSRLAILQSRSMLWPHAIDSLRRAIQADTSRIDLYLLLTRGLYAMAMFEQADMVVQALLTVSPDCLEANVLAAALARRFNRSSDAGIYLERAYSTDPSGCRIARTLFFDDALVTDPHRVIEVDTSGSETSPSESGFLGAVVTSRSREWLPESASASREHREPAQPIPEGNPVAAAEPTRSEPPELEDPYAVAGPVGMEDLIEPEAAAAPDAEVREVAETEAPVVTDAEVRGVAETDASEVTEAAEGGVQEVAETEVADVTDETRPLQSTSADLFSREPLLGPKAGQQTGPSLEVATEPPSLETSDASWVGEDLPADDDEADEVDGQEFASRSEPDPVQTTDLQSDPTEEEVSPGFPDFEAWFKANVLDIVDSSTAQKQQDAEPSSAPKEPALESPPHAEVEADQSQHIPKRDNQPQMEPVRFDPSPTYNDDERSTSREAARRWSFPSFERRRRDEPIKSKLADLAESVGREPLNNGRRFELAQELEAADPAQAVAQYSIIVQSRDPRLVSDIKERLEEVLRSGEKIHGLQRLLGDVCMQRGAFERAIECYSLAFDELRSRQITDKRGAA